MSADITRANNPAGESALGDVIADAQHAATKDPLFGGAVVAFMNPGGIRRDIIAGQISGGEAAGQVTYGELFTVQPFNNVMTVMTCTGAQIEALLEQQFRATGNTILQVPQASRTRGALRRRSAARSTSHRSRSTARRSRRSRPIASR